MVPEVASSAGTLPLVRGRPPPRGGGGARTAAGMATLRVTTNGSTHPAAPDPLSLQTTATAVPLATFLPSDHPPRFVRGSSAPRVESRERCRAIRGSPE